MIEPEGDFMTATDARAQAEQRLAAAYVAWVESCAQQPLLWEGAWQHAKLAAEEIEKQMRMSGLPEDTHRWHLVCADAEKP
jgi:hypothetical protein